MGAMNVFFMITGIILALMAYVDYKFDKGWRVWCTTLTLSLVNLYLGFEPAISGRIPFVA